MPWLRDCRSQVIGFARSTNLEFGQALKLFRLRGGFSARSLSLKCELSQSYISKIESGSSPPPLNTFMTIASELKLNEDEILFLLGLCAK